MPRRLGSDLQVEDPHAPRGDEGEGESAVPCSKDVSHEAGDLGVDVFHHGSGGVGALLVERVEVQHPEQRLGRELDVDVLVLLTVLCPVWLHELISGADAQATLKIRRQLG